ncbi:MAG: B12-binding domain-containing radical SAM protein [Candidatus Omnitrophica bacterium]|nr:B12-binding domain-containing radical SAM protein [Candidatus Omnitrophota bacterium]
MDILLISPDYNNKLSNFPWGVLSLASYLSKVKNYKVVLLDASVYSEPDFYRRLEESCKGISLVGVSLMSTDTYFGKKVIDRIKEIDPEIKIIVGGPHARLQPVSTCAYKNIDFVAYADGEHTLESLFEKIKSKDTDYSQVPGLVYKEGGLIKRTPISSSPDFYDINYELLPERTIKGFARYIQVLTGRGCNFKCTFCFNSVCGQKWRGRPMKDVVRELEGIVAEYHPSIVYFRDDNFFQSKERIFEFIELYKHKKFTFQWRASCRVNYFNEGYITPHVIKELEAINCQVLKFGLESGSQRMLDYLKKGINLEKVKELILVLSKSKIIKPEYSLMIGMPKETTRDYMDTLRLVGFIRKHDPRAAIIGPQYFRVYPGGELYEEIKKIYGYFEPDSFEGWAEKSSDAKNKLLGLGQDLRYPWVPGKYLFLAQNVWQLVLFSRQDVKRYLSLKLMVQMPFILLAKLRVNLCWYSFLIDLRFAVLLKDIKKRLLTVGHNEIN